MAKAYLVGAVAAGLVAMAGSSLAASPAEDGWYGGLDLGRSGLGFGYRFGPSFTIEGSYAKWQTHDAPPAAPGARAQEPWPSYGMTARYDFTKRLFGRFEWDRFGAANELDAFRRADDRYLIRFGFQF